MPGRRDTPEVPIRLLRDWAGLKSRSSIMSWASVDPWRVQTI